MSTHHAHAHAHEPGRPVYVAALSITLGYAVVELAVGLVVNAAVAFVLSRGHHDLNARAALIHVMGDLVSSPRGEKPL